MGNSSFIFWRIPPGPRTWGQVIAWWEMRRLPYNLFVAICAILAAIMFVWLTEFGPNLFLALPLGIFAVNLCYTGGWVVELLARDLLQKNDLRFAPVAMKGGLLFSLAVFGVPLLTLLGIRVISGEPLTLYAAATMSEPVLQNLVATYVVTRYDWCDDDWKSMPGDSLPSLTLSGDGCFTFQDRMHRLTNAFPVPKNEISEMGVFAGDGTWHTNKDDISWGRPTWELVLCFEHPDTYVTHFMLCNQKAPYKICEILGDPDNGEWVIFERAGEIADQSVNEAH